ncbi:unnamed protein product, partial [Vitis vinifera]
MSLTIPTNLSKPLKPSHSPPTNLHSKHSLLRLSWRGSQTMRTKGCCVGRMGCHT